MPATLGRLATPLSLAMVILLAACGGGGDDKSSDGGSPSGQSSGEDGGSGNGDEGAQGAKACALVTQDDAETIFGEAAVQDEDNAPSGLGESGCLWSTVEAEDDPDDLESQLLQFRIWDGEQYYSGEVLEGVTDLALGEKGYIKVSEAGTDLQFVIDGLVYDLSYTNVALGGGGPQNHEAEVRALAERVANEVG